MNNQNLQVTANSKDVKPGSIFFALKGAQFDGRTFILDAIKNGASKVYSEEPFDHPLVTCLGKETRKKLGELASESFLTPTHSLKMIGVTGTSGKTTTTYLIQHILNSCGFKCARVGTNGTSFNGKEKETKNTTPDALELQSYFAEVLKEGATHVVMEVSSHSLHQDRVWGIQWDAVTFLNLSPEHMDYHPTLEHYFQTKAALFVEHVAYSRAHGKNPKISVNLSNEFGEKLFASIQTAEKFSVSENTVGEKVNFASESEKLECPLFGTFQVENILASLKVCLQLGVSFSDAVKSLKNFPGVPGRMESVPNQRGIFVFVDYAHKPEALEKVLSAIQPPINQKLICVFGCGGDRDKSKRPVMGAIGARLSDELILTSDNPRSENPMQILSEIEVGVKSEIASGKAKIYTYEVIEDREAAIRHAIATAKRGDTVLIAGKGHENYQLIGNVKKDFDDREVASREIKKLSF